MKLMHHSLPAAVAVVVLIDSIAVRYNINTEVKCYRCPHKHISRLIEYSHNCGAFQMKMNGMKGKFENCIVSVTMAAAGVRCQVQ